MTERREGFCLALEPLLQIRVGGDVFGQDCDGNRAIEAGIRGLVDFPHVPRAEPVIA